MQQTDERAQRDEYADLALRQFDHIVAMQRDVLEFARGEKSVLIRKVYLASSSRTCAPSSRPSSAAVGSSSSSSSPTVRIAKFDEQKILRVIHNLSRNAAEAMGEKGGRFTIKVSRDTHGALVITFADTGPGIPKEIEHRLFQSFVTSGKKGGTGLAFAIVKRIAEEHGGSVTVKSSTKGATFKLRLPQPQGTSAPRRYRSLVYPSRYSWPPRRAAGPRRRRRAPAVDRALRRPAAGDGPLGRPPEAGGGDLPSQASALSTRRGSTIEGAHPAYYGAQRGPGCQGRWLLVGPHAWVCQDVADPSPDEPALAPLARTENGLPYRYFYAGRDGARGYFNLARALDDAPDQELEPGWSVAIVEERAAHGGAGGARPTASGSRCGSSAPGTRSCSTARRSKAESSTSPG